MVTIFCNTMRASKKRAKPAVKSKTTSFCIASVVRTPADISMDSTKFMKILRIAIITTEIVPRTSFGLDDGVFERSSWKFSVMI